VNLHHAAVSFLERNCSCFFRLVVPSRFHNRPSRGNITHWEFLLEFLARSRTTRRILEFVPVSMSYLRRIAFVNTKPDPAMARTGADPRCLRTVSPPSSGLQIGHTGTCRCDRAACPLSTTRYPQRCCMCFFSFWKIGGQGDMTALVTSMVRFITTETISAVMVPRHSEWLFSHKDVTLHVRRDWCYTYARNLVYKWLLYSFIVSRATPNRCGPPRLMSCRVRLDYRRSTLAGPVCFWDWGVTWFVLMCLIKLIKGNHMIGKGPGFPQARKQDKVHVSLYKYIYMCIYRERDTHTQI